MLKYLRANNKKILAVIGVFLMIAFIVPSVTKSRLRGGASDVIARVGGQKVYGREYHSAAFEWDLLTRRLFMQHPQFKDARMTLPAQQIEQRLMGGMPYYLPQITFQARAIAAQLDALSYMLLLREARQMDARVPEELVRDAMEKLAPLPRDVAEIHAEQAVRHWLMIMEAFDRVAGAARISPAAAFHMMADREQQAQLRLVEFKADSWKKGIEPTPEQLREFFEKYRNIDPDRDDFGFGFRYPDRVRIQYVKVPRDKVKAAVSTEDTYKAYKDRPAAFQALFPATAPATAPATSPSAAAASQPATAPSGPRPWAQLTEQEKDRVRDRIAAERAYAMAREISRLFSQDWPAFKQAMKESPTTVPAKAPETRLGPRYDDYLYLVKVRETVQKMAVAHGVMPVTVEEGRLLSAKELADLPGIGKSRLRLQDGDVPFVSLAMDLFEPWMSPERRKMAQERHVPTLSLFQPSPLLEDAEGNYYLFRIVHAERACAADSLGPLEDRVREAFITSQAYAKAKNAAQEFLARARSEGLEKAAAAAGAAVITTELFANHPEGKLQNYKLPDAAYPKLIEGAFALVQTRLKTGRQHPVDIIELPRAATVVVAELADARPATEDPLLVTIMQRRAEVERTGQLLAMWFQNDAIRSRTQYVPADQHAGPAPPLPPRHLPDVPPDGF